MAPKDQGNAGAREGLAATAQILTPAVRSRARPRARGDPVPDRRSQLGAAPSSLWSLATASE